MRHLMWLSRTSPTLAIQKENGLKATTVQAHAYKTNQENLDETLK